MAEFKVGDTVVITDEYQGSPVGAKAKVVVLEKDYLGLDINGFENGHSLDGALGGKRSGYWIPPNCVKRLNEFKGNV